MRDALNRGGARPDNADAFVGQPGEATGRIAAGIGIVPPARMKAVPREAFDAGDCWKAHALEYAGGDHDEACADSVTLARCDEPAARRLIPRQRFDERLQQRFVIKPKALRDRACIGEDLRPARIFERRDVAHVFEHWHVDIGFDVARSARVAVPVPDAAEVAGLVDDDEVRDAAVGQFRRRLQAPEPRADDGDLNVANDGRALRRVVSIGIIQIAGEFSLGSHILPDPCRRESLVALGPVAIQEIALTSHRRCGQIRISCQGFCAFGHRSLPSGMRPIGATCFYI